MARQGLAVAIPVVIPRIGRTVGPGPAAGTGLVVARQPVLIHHHVAVLPAAVFAGVAVGVGLALAGQWRFADARVADLVHAAGPAGTTATVIPALQTGAIGRATTGRITQAVHPTASRAHVLPKAILAGLDVGDVGFAGGLASGVADLQHRSGTGQTGGGNLVVLPEVGGDAVGTGGTGVHETIHPALANQLPAQVLDVDSEQDLQGRGLPVRGPWKGAGAFDRDGLLIRLAPGRWQTERRVDAVLVQAVHLAVLILVEQAGAVELLGSETFTVTVLVERRPAEPVALRLPGASAPELVPTRRQAHHVLVALQVVGTRTIGTRPGEALLGLPHGPALFVRDATALIE